MEKIKILLLAANPDNTARLALDREAKKIQEELDRSPQRAAVELRPLTACTWEDLQRGLLNFQPHIVHFSGHGEQDGLFFDSANGQAQFIDGEALSRLFGSQQASSVQCVVLNACRSESQAAAFSQHIPYTIGMSQAIGDQAAIDFATGFYRALFSEKAAQSGKLSIELAFESGRSAIDLAGLNEWQTPQLRRKPVPQAPFLPDRPADIVLHANAAQQAWAQEFANELRKHLNQQLGKSCAIALANDLAHPEHAAVHLLLIAEADADFPTIPADAQCWLIVRNTVVPPALNGISQYRFEAARVLDSSHSTEFQELAQVLAQHLHQALININITDQIPCTGHLVFIHTEPDALQIDKGNELSEIFQKYGLSCAVPQLDDYADWVKINQQDCSAVLIVYSDNALWARQRLMDYRALQKKRKKSQLKIIAIQAKAKNIKGLRIDPTVPIFETPPIEEQYIVQHFMEGLK